MSGMKCGDGAAGGMPAPGGKGGAFAASGILVGKDVNRDGVIEPREMGFIQTGGAVAGNASGGFGMACGSGAAGGAAGGAAYGGGHHGHHGGHHGHHGQGIPVPPGGAFAASGVLVGKDANRDGVIERNEMGFIATGGAISGGGGGIIDGGENCDDCVRTVTTYKTVQVPCTRNRYKVVNYTVPKTIPFTDYETVTKTKTITKQIPKTIYVPTQVEVPYQTKVPVTKYKTVQVHKQRTECSPHTTVVSRRIPVVNVIPNPPPPCPPQPCDDGVMPLEHPHIDPQPQPAPGPDCQPMPLPQPRY